MPRGVDLDLPKPLEGEEVWFYLRKPGPYVGRWVTATVIEHIKDPDTGEMHTKLLRARRGTLHLRVDLDQEEDNATDVYGYRLDVPEGDEPGMWARTPPRGHEQAYEERKRQQGYIEQARREANRTR